MEKGILITSDIHRDLEYFLARLQDNMITSCICCGDLSTEFPEDYKTLIFPKPVYAVYGNNESWKYVHNYKVHNLTWMEAGKIYNLNGYRIAGMGGVMSKTPNNPKHFTEEEVNSSLKIGYKGVDIFVTHHPPKLYADLCTKYTRKHCGSPSVFKLLDEIRPKLFLSGHLHWPQTDIFGTHGRVETYVVTLGKFGQGDYGILTRNRLTLFKKNVKCYEIYWQNSSCR